MIVGVPVPETDTVPVRLTEDEAELLRVAEGEGVPDPVEEGDRDTEPVLDDVFVVELLPEGEDERVAVRVPGTSVVEGETEGDAVGEREGKVEKVDVLLTSDATADIEAV